MKKILQQGQEQIMNEIIKETGKTEGYENSLNAMFKILDGKGPLGVPLFLNFDGNKSEALWYSKVGWHNVDISKMQSFNGKQSPNYVIYMKSSLKNIKFMDALLRENYDVAKEIADKGADINATIKIINDTKEIPNYEGNIFNGILNLREVDYRIFYDREGEIHTSDKYSTSDNNIKTISEQIKFLLEIGVLNNNEANKNAALNYRYYPIVRQVISDYVNSYKI